MIQFSILHAADEKGIVFFIIELSALILPHTIDSFILGWALVQIPDLILRILDCVWERTNCMLPLQENEAHSRGYNSRKSSYPRAHGKRMEKDQRNQMEYDVKNQSFLADVVAQATVAIMERLNLRPQK